MKIIITLLFSCYSLFAIAQADYTPVDRAAIEKAISDSSSPNYYPTLLKRYLAFDTTLYVEDYRMLYYGFVFQDGYNGYNDNKSKDIREAMGKKDFKKAIRLCDEVLKGVPVSLTVNYLKGLALYNQDQKDSTAFQYMEHYKYLMGAILSSGDGLTCPTAFKTIFVADEYEVIYVQFEVKKFMSQSLVYPCDMLSIEPSESFPKDKIYFDTSETFLAMDKMFKKK